MSASGRSLLALLLSLSLVWSQTFLLAAPAGAASAPALPPAVGPHAGIPRDVLDRQMRLFRALALMRERIDRTGFDPAALARTLSGWREAYAFVRDRVALVPYSGILRFADGTLASRAGNACDRALLLAELLKAMGQEVRFARARLEEPTVERLRRLIDRPPVAASRPPAVDRPDPALAAALAEAGLPAEALGQAVAETRERTAALIGAFARTLADVRTGLAEVFGPPLQTAGGRSGEMERSVRAALSDHCWVRMREGGRWLDLDPTPGLAPGETLAPSASVSEVPDPALVPMLELRLLLHRRRGEKRESTEVLGARLRPDSARWTAQIALVPEVLGPRMLETLAASRSREGFDVFVPLLRTPRGVRVGEPFDASGRVVATDLRVRNAGRTGETVGGLFGGAFGALREALGEGGAPEEKPSTFDGLELRLVLHQPDGRARHARRLLVPPMPADQLRHGAMLTVELALASARVPRGELLAEAVDTMLAVRPLWIAAVSGADPLRTELAARRVHAVSTELRAFLQLRSAVTEYIAAEAFPDLVVVPDGPHLIARFERSLPGASGPRLERGFDLVFTDLRALPREPATAVDTGAAVRLLSLADNVLEHVAAGPEAWSGVALLAAVRAQGVPLTVVRQAGDLAWLAHVPAYARGLIAEELAAGRLVALPSAPLRNGRFAFWSLDPASGMVRATGADGTGQAASEYAEQIAALVIGTLAGCGVGAVMGDIRSAGDLAFCIAVGLVVGYAVNTLVGALATRFGWGTAAKAGVSGAADAAATSAAYRAFGRRGGHPGEPRARSAPHEGGGARAAPSDPLSPSAMERALAGPGSAPATGTGAGGGAGLARAGGRGRSVAVPGDAGSPVGRLPRSGTAAAGTGPGGAAAGLRGLAGRSAGSGPRASRATAAEASGSTAARTAGTAGEGASAGTGSGGTARRGGGSGPADIRKIAPEGYELATPTPKPVTAAKTEITPTMRKIRSRPGDTPEQAAAKTRFREFVKAVEEMNLPWTTVGELRSFAKAYNSVMVTREVNPHALRWMKQGAVGKNMFMKGKSADRGAIAGLIPENQAYSKLYGKVERARARLKNARTAEERAAAKKDLEQAWKDIGDYNKKVQEGVKQAGYEFVPFQVDGNPVNVYRRGGRLFQAYEKNGILYDATTRRPLPGKAAEYGFVEPLRVVGVKEVDPKTGRPRVRYVTADVDLDAVIRPGYAPREQVIKWKPEAGERFGNRTPRTEAMLKGMRNVAKAARRDPDVSHGPESWNPFPGKLTPESFPRLAVFPDGSARVLRNPYDLWKLYSDLKKAGWKVDLPEPVLKAYGWMKETDTTPPKWWEEMPDAVKPWAPGGGDRPSPRRRNDPAGHRRRKGSR